MYDTIRREVPAQEDPGGCLVASYLGEIGIREEGGNNRGERIQEYLQAVNLGPGFAWCAAFICWNLDQCDITNPSSAWSPAVGLYNVIYSRGDEVFPSARPGLVFALYYKNLGRIGHVGFIHQVKDEQVITVEGNTNGDGSRDGDGVHKKIRPTWAIYRVSSYL